MCVCLKAGMVMSEVGQMEILLGGKKKVKICWLHYLKEQIKLLVSLGA